MQPQKNREKAIDKGMLALLCTLVFRISNPFHSVMFCFHFTIQLFMKFVKLVYFSQKQNKFEKLKVDHPQLPNLGVTNYNLFSTFFFED